jgi:cytochrome P450
MRLYPPAWIIGRVAKEDFAVCGLLVKKGQDGLISPYVVQRSERLWNKPNKFDPSRFLGDRKKEIDKFAFFPFSGGPRICVGEQFAMMEMIIAIAII